MNFENQKIEIITDEITIVEVFSSQKYKIWDDCHWKKGNDGLIIKCAREWFVLSCLVKKIGDMTLHFSKASKEDRQNELVHGYANYARKLQFYKKHTIHIMEAENDEDFEFKEIVNVSKNKEVDEILNIKRPWIINKNKATDFKWYTEGQYEIIYIDTHDIIITEEVHLNCNSLNFNTLFRTAAESHTISYPIAVRPLGNGKYSLVAGITRLITAKLFDISRVPCVVTDFSNEEFLKHNLVKYKDK